MAFQYQTLAQQVAQKIYLGELEDGQRLPSLRDFADQQKISLNTAKSCYELLEARGLVFVKAKSGYFIKAPKLQVEQPYHDDFESHARDVSNLDLQIEIQATSIQEQSIHLGAIQLSPKLIPIDLLRRSIQRALKHSKPEDFLYSDRQGHSILREALVSHWAEDGLFISKDDIFITNGCMPALSVVLQTLTEEGDSIIVPTPNFNGQLQLLASLKRKIVEIPAHHNGFNLERLEHEMKHSGAKACLLTANFQNPLGFCLTNEDKQKIAELAEKYQCFIIEDDIYAECGFEQNKPLPIRYWDTAGYVIYCGSVSKSLSSAYRVGWFCITAKLTSFRAQFINRNVVVNTPLQLGLADLIHCRAYRTHLNQLRPKLFQQVAQYRHYIQQAFNGVDVRISQPEGGYSLWLQLPESINSLDMYYFAQTQKINIVPGIVFGEDARYSNCIRLNAGHELSDEIKQAIDVLAQWVKCNL